jgi:hypothetical protein
MRVDEISLREGLRDNQRADIVELRLQPTPELLVKELIAQLQRNQGQVRIS